MLNELRELALSLEKADIFLEDLHPNFKACPKYPAIQVGIDRDGNIAGLTKIPQEQVLKIRKWEKANGISFPAFNIQPLLKARLEEVKDKSGQKPRMINKNIEAIKKRLMKGGVVSYCEIATEVDSSEVLMGQDKLIDCLTKPIADFNFCLDNAPQSFTSISELISRSKKIDARKFTEQLTTLLVNTLVETGDASFIDLLFFYSGDTPKNNQLVLELSDFELFEFPANHSETQKWMNRQLIGATSYKKIDGVDAFGCDPTGSKNKFPEIGFKNALGKVILRAMNQESPCQSRYSMIDFDSFPAGEEARKSMKSALEWLGSPEQKGKTWCDLTKYTHQSKQKNRGTILFAYPSILPEKIPDFAGMLGDAEEIGEDNSETFSTLAEKVTVALHGRSNDTIDCDIRVFVLAKMDKARTKVMVSSRYAVSHVIQSAEKWQEGCRAIPEIEIRCFGKNKGDKPTWQKPLIPFPAEVVWCLNTVWMAGKDDKGERISRAKSGHGFTINDALCILLGDGIELNHVANRSLNAVTRSSSSMLLAIRQAHTIGKVHKIENDKYSKQLRLIPSIIALLLYKLGHTKGELMASPAFLIGRFLSLADSLHHEYCKHVSKNIPPQLLGNAHMSIALECPERSISMLSQRLFHPYQSWARTVTGGDEVALAKYCLKLLGEVSEQLKDVSLPQQATDTDKAQIMLGYLARTKQD